MHERLGRYGEVSRKAVTRRYAGLDSIGGDTQKFYTDFFGRTQINFLGNGGQIIARMFTEYLPHEGLNYEINSAGRQIYGILERGKTLRINDDISLSSSYNRKKRGRREHVKINMKKGFRFKKIKN